MILWTMLVGRLGVILGPGSGGRGGGAEPWSGGEGRVMSIVIQIVIGNVS